MRPKFRRNKGGYFDYDLRRGFLSALWTKQCVSFIATFGYAELLGYQRYSIVQSVENGKNAKKIIKQIIRLANQRGREKKKVKKYHAVPVLEIKLESGSEANSVFESKSGNSYVMNRRHSDSRSVIETGKDEIHLSVGAVNEPSSFLTSGRLQCRKTT